MNENIGQTQMDEREELEKKLALLALDEIWPVFNERERVATAVWDRFKTCDGERKFVLREIVKFIRDGAIK